MTAGVNCGSPQPLQRLNTKATTKRRSESHSACDSYVRFGSLADIGEWIRDVRFMLESGHVRARTPFSRLGFRTKPRPNTITPCHHYPRE